MTIREIMTRGPWTIGETDTLGNAQQAMSQHHVRHLPVISEGHLVGMLSERDVLATRAHAEPDDRWWKLPVSLAMEPPETVDVAEPVEAAATRMGSTQLGALAVTEQGTLVGVVSVIDILLAHTATIRTTPAHTAGEAMTAHPPTVTPEQSLLAAVRLMCSEHVHELPVVNEDGKVVGMITEADVRKRVGDPATYLTMHADHPCFDVQDVMDVEIVPVGEDRPVSEIAHYFSDPRIDALPVVDAEGALVGGGSYLDTLNALAS